MSASHRHLLVLTPIGFELVEYFRQLREELLRRETAEEQVVYPAFRRSVPDGHEVGDACLAEQSEAEQWLARLEKYETSPWRSVRVSCSGAAPSVNMRADEEDEIFPALESRIKPKQLPRARSAT